LIWDTSLARILVRPLAILALSLMLGACQAQASAVPPSFEPTGTAAEESPSELPFLTPGPSPTFPAGRVATRIVISRLKIDLPVMLQTPKYGTFPLCDVALYLPELGQPGQGRATYIYAHARAGMFLPLLSASLIKNGQGMIGDLVQIYTSDDFLFTYRIAEVHRHALSLIDAFEATTEKLFLQTSEGPHGTIPKLQVVARFLAVSATDETTAHPIPHPVICG
jgi:hypothetical protein